MVSEKPDISLIALLIPGALVYGDVPVELWCSEPDCSRNPLVGSFKGSGTLQGPFAFSPGCAHQGRGLQYPMKTGVSAQNCMTSIVEDTGHSASCGKTLN